MVLQKQVIHFPFAKGLELRTGKVSAEPPELVELVNGHWEKNGSISKRNGFELLPVNTIVNGAAGTDIGAGYWFGSRNGKLVMMTDQGAAEYSDGVGWLVSGSPMDLGEVSTLVAPAPFIGTCPLRMAIAGNYMILAGDKIWVVNRLTGAIIATTTRPTTVCAAQPVTVWQNPIDDSWDVIVVGDHAAANVDLWSWNSIRPYVLTYHSHVIAYAGESADPAIQSGVCAIPGQATGTIAVAFVASSTGAIMATLIDVSITTVAHAALGYGGAALAGGSSLALASIESGTTHNIVCVCAEGSPGKIQTIRTDLSLSVIGPPYEATAALPSNAYRMTVSQYYGYDGYVAAWDYYDTPTKSNRVGVLIDAGSPAVTYIEHAHVAASLSIINDGVGDAIWIGISPESPSDTQQSMVAYIVDSTSSNENGQHYGPLIRGNLPLSTKGPNGPLASPGADLKILIPFAEVARDLGSALELQPKVVSVTRHTHSQAGVDIGGQLFVPGVQVQLWDADLGVNELPMWPEAATVVAKHTTTGHQSDGTYQSCAVFEWYDSNGNRHQSAQSAITTVVLSGGGTSQYFGCTYPLPWFASSISGNTFKAYGRDVALVEYRTVMGGSIFHRKPTTDQYTEAAIAVDEILYTNGGTLENIPPPPVAAMTRTRNRLMLASAERMADLWVSKDRVAGDGVGFNDSLVLTQQNPITAMATLNDATVVFTTSNIGRDDGDWPDNAGAGSFPIAREIYRGVGCVDRRSLVEIPQGVLFKSANGWFLLDQGFALQPIGKSVQDFDSKTVLRCLSLVARGEAWLIHTDGTVLVWDWIRQQWASHAVGSMALPVDAVVCNDLACLMDAAGQAYREDGSYVDNAADISTKITTGWYSFAGMQGFQRVYAAMLLGEWKSSHTLTVKTYFDFVETIVDTKVLSITSDPAPYQVKIKPSVQKCQAIKLSVEDSNVAGAGFVLSDIAFEIGVIGGLARVKAGKVI